MQVRGLAQLDAPAELPRDLTLSFYQRRELTRLCALFRDLPSAEVAEALGRHKWSFERAMDELQQRVRSAEAIPSSRPVKDSEENDDEPLILHSDLPVPRTSGVSEREKLLEKDLRELTQLAAFQANALRGLEERAAELLATRQPFAADGRLLLPVGWCRQHLPAKALAAALAGPLYRLAAPRP